MKFIVNRMNGERHEKEIRQEDMAKVLEIFLKHEGVGQFDLNPFNPDDIELLKSPFNPHAFNEQSLQDVINTLLLQVYYINWERDRGLFRNVVCHALNQDDPEVYSYQDCPSTVTYLGNGRVKIDAKPVITSLKAGLAPNNCFALNLTATVFINQEGRYVVEQVVLNEVDYFQQIIKNVVSFEEGPAPIITGFNNKFRSPNAVLAAMNEVQANPSFNPSYQH